MLKRRTNSGYLAIVSNGARRLVGRKDGGEVEMVKSSKSKFGEIMQKVGTRAEILIVGPNGSVIFRRIGSFGRVKLKQPYPL